MLPFIGNELLRGEKVYLTPIQRADCAVFATWSEDMEYQRLLRRGEVFPDIAESFERWLFSENDHEELYRASIRTNADNTLIGMCEINRIFRQARHCMFWIGMGDPAYRGHGYGSDAIRTLLRYAFLEMNLNRVGLEVMSYNARAIAAYERIGFQHEGRQRETVIRDGVYYDTLLMSILRREWEARYWHKPETTAAE
ncbi:MAG: GNAT family N-acetyltransferase [Anaerolineae bacterium]|nr:GNAT family N-acetyltransferase [Anaerolineae bacterium]